MNQFSRDNESLEQRLLTISPTSGIGARTLRRVVLDLDTQRLKEFHILIADLEIGIAGQSGYQGSLVAGFLAGLAYPDGGFQHQKDVVTSFFDPGNDIGNGLGINCFNCWST